MASRQHDFIIEMIKIKMKSMGYEIVCSDSHYNQVSPYQSTPTIVSHKPDCLGYKEMDNSICIGEAKFSGDYNNARTVRQIKDYVDLVNSNDRYNLILGVVDEDKPCLDNIIKKNNLILNKRTLILKVPKGLLPNEKQKL